MSSSFSDKTYNRNHNGFFVQRETMTLASGASAVVNSNAFDGRANQDFGVFANIGATNLATACPLNILGSLDGVTYMTAKSALVADVDNATTYALYDYSANGSCPFYKIQLAPADTMLGEEVEIGIVWAGGK